MRPEDCYLEKVILSCGLGGQDRTFIRDVSEHLAKILGLSSLPVTTFCKRPVARWKIRKGTPMGLKLTMRGCKAHAILRVLLRRAPELSYDRRSSSFRGGFRSHRDLSLEKYDPSAPEYGFNVIAVIGFKGKRSWTRRIDSCRKPIKLVPEEHAKKVLQC